MTAWIALGLPIVGLLTFVAARWDARRTHVREGRDDLRQTVADLREEVDRGKAERVIWAGRLSASESARAETERRCDIEMAALRARIVTLEADIAALRAQVRTSGGTS